MTQLVRQVETLPIPRQALAGHDDRHAAVDFGLEGARVEVVVGLDDAHAYTALLQKRGEVFDGIGADVPGPPQGQRGILHVVHGSDAARKVLRHVERDRRGAHDFLGRQVALQPVADARDELTFILLAQPCELAERRLDGSHALRAQEKRHVYVQRLGEPEQHLRAGLRLAPLVLRNSRRAYARRVGQRSLGELAALAGLFDADAGERHTRIRGGHRVYK